MGKREINQKRIREDDNIDSNTVAYFLNYDVQWHYNQPVLKYKHNHKQTKSGDAHESSDQCRVKNGT